MKELEFTEFTRIRMEILEAELTKAKKIIAKLEAARKENAIQAAMIKAMAKKLAGSSDSINCPDDCPGCGPSINAEKAAECIIDDFRIQIKEQAEKVEKARTEK